MKPIVFWVSIAIQTGLLFFAMLGFTWQILSEVATKATKSDIENLRTELRAEIRELRNDYQDHLAYHIEHGRK